MKVLGISRNDDIRNKINQHDSTNIAWLLSNDQEFVAIELWLRDCKPVGDLFSASEAMETWKWIFYSMNWNSGPAMSIAHMNFCLWVLL